MKEAAIKIIGYEKCTGCYGCLNTCPIEKAIEFKLTEEGFFKPFITEKCVQCGKCQNSCPVIKEEVKNIKEDLEVYSCWSRDEEVVKNSSSGGVFSELAKFYLENEGIVFGAKWDKGEIRHTSIDKIEDLKYLQKSKYLQSKIEKSYNEVEKKLKEGKKVLFVGTPCEVAALNLIVKNENLLTVDFICHGIPSYTAYQKYIRENFNFNIKDIVVDFRNKETGWENFNLTFKIESKIIKRNNHREDIWFKGFLDNIYLNTPCYNCKYRNIPRNSDITLGDFWGVPEELKNPAGTSVVTINSKKGKQVFEKIKDNIEYKETTFKVAHSGNPCLYKYKLNDNKRKKFFKDFSKKTFLELHEQYFSKPSFISKNINFIRRIISFFKRKLLRIIKEV